MIEQSEHPTVLKKTPRKRSLEYDTLSGRSAHSLVAKAQELYMFGGYGGEGRCKSVLTMVTKLQLQSLIYIFLWDISRSYIC